MTQPGNSGVVRLWQWTSAGLTARPGVWSTLDAQSLELPTGVYTTLRTYGGRRILGLSHHLQRLAESAHLLGGGCTLDIAWVRLGLREVLDVSSLPEMRLRITVPLSCGEVHFGVEPFVPFPAELYARGARCRTSGLARSTPQAKSTAFIARARRARSTAGPEIHELLLLDPLDRILEGTSSNFFAVIQGELRTAGEGVLAGVTRTLILELARPLLPVREEAVAVAALAQAQEAFLTSSSREVMPVAAVDDITVGAGVPGVITETLARAYRQHRAATAEEP